MEIKKSHRRFIPIHLNPDAGLVWENSEYCEFGDAHGSVAYISTTILRPTDALFSPPIPTPCLLDQMESLPFPI